MVFIETLSIFFHECSYSDHRGDDGISYEIWTRKTIPNASHVDSLPSVSREDVHVSSTLAHDDTRWIVYDDA